MSFNQIGHNDVCNHTCARTFLRDLGVDKWTDVSAEVGDTITSARSTEIAAEEVVVSVVSIAV